MASSKSKSSSYPLPLIFPPLQLPHKTTLIILHGRGSTASKFAEPLLTHPVSVSTSVSSEDTTPLPPQSFRSHFPNTKFVFPTASLRRAVAYNRSLTHQWFDCYSIFEPDVKPHLQIQGLRETTAFLHGLLRKEIEAVGRRNVVLMGLSQGCAAGLVAGMLWEGEGFAGFVGICGFLPFRGEMEGAANGEEGEGEDLFERESEVAEEGSGSGFERAIRWLRGELGTAGTKLDDEKNEHPFQTVPIFMGHGTEDEKVPCDLGKSAAGFLGSVGINVQWKEYEGLGHWYSEDMLRDVVHFIKNLEGWG